MLNQALLERYRCRESLAEFNLTGKLSPDAGFFTFGPHTVCYGKTAAGFRSHEPAAGLYDTCGDVTTSDSQVVMPFDPNAIVDNLRLERYAIDHNLNGRQRSPTVSAEGLALCLLFASTSFLGSGAETYSENVSPRLGETAFSALARG